MGFLVDKKRGFDAVLLINACNAQMSFLVDKKRTFQREFDNGPSP
jgi:hypothetical protein